MVKEGYKEVKALGEKYIIPEEWSLKELSEVLTVIRNGSSKKQNKQGKGLPVSRIETIADGTINYDKIGYVDLESEDLKKHKLEKGDILFSHINSIAHIGKVAQYKADKKLYHGMNLLKLRFDNEKVTDQFMLHRLKSVNAKHFYERYAKQAVNQASLNQNDVGLYTFPLPPLPEQKKISSILSSVDESIEKTDEVIEETKELKKGLMQELLTKGIGHSEFKDSQFGKIPKEWRVEQVKNVSKINLGASPSSYTYNDSGNGLPFFQGNADFGFLYPIPTQWCTDPKKIAEKGEVLISVRAPVGELNLAPFECCIGRGLTSIDGKDVENKYIFYYFKQFKAKLESYSQGSTFSAITKSILETFPILVPPKEEQKKIASILSSVDAKIKKEEEYKSKLERLKKGLMQKLLTGEIRVNTEMEV